MNKNDKKIDPKVAKLPIIALKNKVLFPGEMASLIFEREASLLALQEALQKNLNPVFVAQRKATEDVSPKTVYDLGTCAKVVRVWKMPNGLTGVLVEGLKKTRIIKFGAQKSFLVGDTAELPDFIEPISAKKIEAEALYRNIMQIFQDIVSFGAMIPMGTLSEINDPEADPKRVMNLVATSLNAKVSEKQKLLEEDNWVDFLKKVYEILGRERDILEVGKKVQSETQKQINRVTKEALLREQLKAIERELIGEGGEEGGEYVDLRKAVKKAKMPSEVEKKAMRELARLEKMPPFAPESSYIQNYLEIMVELPWSKKNKVNIDLAKAEEILNDDHYGLAEVKERVLEYLAVEKLTGKPQGTILCFFGPPGTGKTSIGESIAKATGREFVKVSLGGVRDETEIRGHRRTYVGAMPGRIIQGLKNISSNNPVFMLDEIDKLGADFRGDPSAALLEVLDPAQNKSFMDHYLDVPFDLSDIIFITTANDMATIPEPLKDRMEIIEFSSYTAKEKLEIAKRYLVKRVLKKSGLTEDQLNFEDEAVLKIIHNYTYEAGVRNLEREISKIARKVAKEYLLVKQPKTTKKFAVSITPKSLTKYLKTEKHHDSLINDTDQVGVATGLAWTPNGGDILFIETNVYAGKGQLMLTGHLGKVMKESAQAAYSYVKANAKQFGIDEKMFKSMDVHVHVPAGAIPKDGPSAGLAIATSIVSALTKKPVSRVVGMTGEINLRGKALQIGGVKNKVLAAHRAGITTILLPEDNKADLEEISDDVKKDVTFITVKSFEEIYKKAILTK
jgi:ATP-dependent Lon protease